MAKGTKHRDACKLYRSHGVRERNRELRAERHAKRVAKKLRHMEARSKRIERGSLKLTRADLRYEERSANAE